MRNPFPIVIVRRKQLEQIEQQVEIVKQTATQVIVQQRKESTKIMLLVVALMIAVCACTYYYNKNGY